MLLLNGFGVLQAQVDVIAPELVTTAFERLIVYEGPGETHLEAGILNAGVEVVIVERNRIGNWVRVNMLAQDGSVVLDGWVISGYLNLDAGLRFADVPVNETALDADPMTVNSESLARLYAVPVISDVSEAMRDVYQRGQEMGNISSVVTKVGDSVSANPLYLMPMSQYDYQLGRYDYLEDTLLYFGKSAGIESVASRIGMTTYVIFDPFWADKELCLANESPLDCEYRLKRPSVAVILFGANDVRHMTDAEYAVQMRLIVEQTLDKGIIPVLTTFSADPDEALWWQSINFNLALAEIAAEYEVPLINLWSAARILPDYGLEIDHVHMQNSGFDFLKFDSGHEVFYGVTLHNLLTIRMLDEIRVTLKMN